MEEGRQKHGCKCSDSLHVQGEYMAEELIKSDLAPRDMVARGLKDGQKLQDLANAFVAQCKGWAQLAKETDDESERRLANDQAKRFAEAAKLAGAR